MQTDESRVSGDIPPGSDFYYALRFAPAGKRDAIGAVHSVCAEISEIPRECSDTGVARLKLQWWRDEIRRTWQDAPRHPATKDLRPHLPHYNLPEEYLHEFIDGVCMDLDRTDYPEFSELALYCHRVSGTTQSMIAEILGYTDRQTHRYATDLGISLKLMQIICDLHQSRLHGQHYLPRDDLETFRVDPDSLLRNEDTQALSELLARQSARARELLQRARERLPDSDRSRQTFGLILAAIAEARLNEVQADNYRVLSHRIELTPVRKLWIAWRTARRCRRQA